MKKTLLLTTLLLSVTALSSCQQVDPEFLIKVGASATPHAEILNQVKKSLKQDGYTLKVIEYTDYIIPNIALEDGEIDANYFQHITYLNEFNESYNTHLVSVASVHYEPLGIYAGKKKSLDQISNGDKIFIPNDLTNGGRALYLLEKAGLIELDENAGVKATKYDIKSNPLNLNIVELNAELIAPSRHDAAYAVINGNYAISNNINVSDALEIEDSSGLAVTAYANVIAVKEGNEESPKIQALKKALLTTSVRDYIINKYKGSVVPLF